MASTSGRPSAKTGTDSSPPAGPQLKDYVMTDRLGSGTYATVYKAYKKVCISVRQLVEPTYTMSDNR